MSGRRRPARRARRSSGRSGPSNPASDARSARPAVQGIRHRGRIFFGGDRGPLGRADCGPRTRLRRVFVRRLCRFLPCGELVPRPRLHLPGKRAHPHDAVASPRTRRALELVSLAVAAFLVGYFGWYACDMTIISYRLKDVSQGLVAVPLWIPQAGMALGLVTLFVATTDDL